MSLSKTRSHRQVPAPARVWWLQVGLPAIVLGVGLIIIVIWLLSRYCLTPVEPRAAAYQIAGEPNWVLGRVWNVRDPDTDRLLTQSDLKGQILVTDFTGQVALAHDDWQAQYLLTVANNSECLAAGAPQAQVVECAQEHRQTINLDHDLDESLNTWREAILLRDWEQLAPLTQVKETTPLTQLLDSWLDELLAAGYTPVSADIYVETEVSTPEQARALVFWQLEDAKGQKTLRHTPLILVKDAQAWVWQFSGEALPTLSVN